MNPRAKQFIVFFIGWPLSILSIYIIIITFIPKFSQIQQLLVNINYYLFLNGIICFLIYYFLRSLIWQKILKQKGYKLPFQKSNLLWASSEFKRYIPGNIWSFIGRAILYSNEGVKKADLTKSLFTELQFILTGAVLVSLFSFPYLIKIMSQINYLHFLTFFIYFCGISIFCVFVFQTELFNLTKGRLNVLLSKIFPKYSPIFNFRILTISGIAFLFLGLGYYLTISSIVFLDITLVLTLTGFFVFSLLVGLFSFITPAGLGIREGMVTFGLKSIIPLHVAGFASIFGRISLVFAEIIYLCLSYIYSLINSAFINKFEIYLTDKKYKLILLIGIIVFNLYFIPVSFLRYDNFYTGRFDLGNMDQTVWNTKNGRIFQFTNPDGTENISRLAFHADYFLVLISPLYFIWNSPKTLLLVQSVVASLGAVFIYLLSLKIIDRQHRLLALFISISYLLNPSLQWSILYDFHSVTLATTFLLGAYYFMIDKKYFRFIIFGILSGSTKEQVWLPISLMGLVIAIKGIKLKINLINSSITTKFIQLLNIKYSQILLGLIIFIIPLFAFYYLISEAIPNASVNKSYFALSYFDSKAESSTHLITNLVSSPYNQVLKLIQEDRILYYFALLEPLGYLPILALYMLIFASADIMLNIFGDRSTLYQIYYQYTAVITPFLYLALIYGISYFSYLIRYLYKNTNKIKFKNNNILHKYLNTLLIKFNFIYKLNNKSILLFNLFAFYVLISAINGAYKYGPLPWTKKANVAMLNNPQINKAYISKLLDAIPEDSSVSSTNNLGAHLSHREYLYTVPIATDSADFVLFLLRPNSPDYEREIVSDLRLNPNYSLTNERNGFFMFKNKH